MSRRTLPKPRPKRPRPRLPSRVRSPTPTGCRQEVSCAAPRPTGAGPCMAGCAMAGLKLIVGLGNPGAEYLRTRHNAGFWLVDALAGGQGERFAFDGKLHGEACRVRIGGEGVWLLKPSTFMNKSGIAVASALRYYKIQ